jgi:hypothetical protein
MAASGGVMSALKQSIKGLFFGGRDALSLGRVAFWLCFILAVIKWAQDIDIPSSHESMLMGIMIYCLGGKVVNTYKGQGRETKLEVCSEADSNVK